MGYIAAKSEDRLDRFKDKKTSTGRRQSDITSEGMRHKSTENKEIKKQRNDRSKSRQVPSEPKRTGVDPVDGKLSVSVFDDTLHSSSSAGQQTDVSSIPSGCTTLTHKFIADLSPTHKFVDYKVQKVLLNFQQNRSYQVPERNIEALLGSWMGRARRAQVLLRRR